MAKDFLLIIGDREPLAWILTERKMAFPAHRSRDVSHVSKGDRLFIYTTRGCFHSPGHDRGRVIGEASVTSSISELKDPVEFGDRSYSMGCSLSISGLAARDNGPEMVSLVKQLHLFSNSKSNPQSWGTRLRRVLAPLDEHDAGVLHKNLDPVMKPLAQTRGPYLLKTTYDTTVGT